MESLESQQSESDICIALRADMSAQSCPTHDFPGGSDGKASAYGVGDLGSTPGSGRSSGEGNGNPLQHFCLGNSMDRGAWWATVRGVTKNRK